VGEKEKCPISPLFGEKCRDCQFLAEYRKKENSSKGEPCPGCGQPVAAGVKICPNCGLNLMATYM